MKKFFIYLFTAIIISNTATYAEENYIINENSKKGLSYFFSAKIYESIIKRELKDELKGDFDVTIDIFDSKSLKDGYFKSLTLYSPKVEYKGLSMSNAHAQTINNINKILYENKRVYFPEELPLKFSGEINNDDLNNILNSELFFERLDKINEKYGNFLRADTPTAEIKNNKIYFTIPLSTIFSKNPFYVEIDSELATENGEIIFKDINFTKTGKFIDYSIFNTFLTQLSPFKLGSENLKTKFCKITVESVQINDNIIIVDGLLTINKKIRENK